MLSHYKEDGSERMSYSIYTDGGCSGNPGPGGWAYLILKDGELILEKSGGEALTTNNKMELSAVISSLSFLYENGIREASLYTDSQYVKNGITNWIFSWKRNGWRTSQKGEVKNKEYWVKLDELNSKLNIEWNWVKGHAGLKWNERVDELTQLEIAKFR